MEEEKNISEAAAEETLEETTDIPETETAGEAENAAEENSGAAEEQTAEENAPEGNADEAGDTAENAESGKKKGFFSKKKDKKDEQIEELTDRNRRLMAEFDNYRKRTEKEKTAMFEVGAKSVIEKILPVVDNFERGLASIPEDQKDSPVAQGMDMVYKQLLTALKEIGVEPIEAVGKPFDPNLHNAVMHTEDDSLGENVVAQEFQKGYTYRDSVVRHSMVQVAN